MAVADIFLRLRANSAELTQGLERAKSSMKKTSDASSAFGKTMSGVFKEAGRAIDNIIPGFSSFVSKLGMAKGATAGLSGAFKILKFAIASTGIGLLVIALGTLVSYFKNTDAGADKFAKAMNAIKSVISTVLTRVNLLGEAITLLLQGKFKDAAAKAKEAVSDLGAAIKDSYEKGNALGERKNKLEDAQIAFITEEIELQNKLSKAKEVLNDADASSAEKQKANNEAVAAENALFAKKSALLSEEYAIMVEQHKLGEKTDETDRAEQELLGQIIALQGEKSQAMVGISRGQKRINKEIEDEAKAIAIANMEREKGLNLTPFKAAAPGITTFAPKIDTTTLIPATKQVATLTDAFKLLFKGVKAFEEMPNPFEFLKSSIDTLSSTLSQGAKNFKDYGRSVLSTIKNIVAGYLAESLAAMIANAFKTAGKTGPGALILAPLLAAAAVGLVTTSFNKLIPGFASGGIVSGPTMGLVGEYAGARSNPEVIAPLSDLKNILGNSFGGEVRFRIEGTELVGVLNKQDKINSSF